MDFPNVTFACEDEISLKHTKVFHNKNMFQCYHNNRGYCSFGDQCKYRHFKDICGRTVCRERECNKRHPVICRYRDDCKFLKINKCAFKHKSIETNVVSTDFENHVKEIESLNIEIMELKNDIKNKEKQLHKSKMEIQELTVKLTLLPQNQQSKKDIMEENDVLKKEVEMLKKENIALKIKLVQNDQTDDENTIQLEEKDDTKTSMKISCEKCWLNFSSKDKSKKHKSEIHKAKLTF